MRWPQEPFDGAGVLMRSSWGQHATLSGSQTKPRFVTLVTVTSGFCTHGLNIWAGGVASVATRLCRPLYGEGAACYHFNASLHKCGRMRKAGGSCCSRPLRKTPSRLSDWRSVQHYIFYPYLFMQNRGEPPCHGAAGCSAIHKNAPSFTSALLPYNCTIWVIFIPRVYFF